MHVFVCCKLDRNVSLAVGLGAETSTSKYLEHTLMLPLAFPLVRGAPKNGADEIRRVSHHARSTVSRRWPLHSRPPPGWERETLTGRAYSPAPNGTEASEAGRALHGRSNLDEKWRPLIAPTKHHSLPSPPLPSATLFLPFDLTTAPSFSPHPPQPPKNSRPPFFHLPFTHSPGPFVEDLLS